MADKMTSTGPSGRLTAEQEKFIHTLGDIVDFQSARQPGNDAVVYGDRKMTFRDLQSVSNQFANALVSEGFEPGTRVAFLDRNSEWFFPILFGTAKANGTLVTVNFRLTPVEISYILGDSGAEIVCVGAEFLDNVKACRKDLPTLRKIIVIDGDGADHQGLADWVASQPESAPARRVSPEDTAVQMYTSGTTGHPKGVELTHNCMTAAAVDGLTVWPAMFRENAAVLGIMPLFHIAAANLCIASLYAGGRAEIMRDGTPEQIIRLIAERGIAVAPLPAAVIHEIIKLPFVSDLDLSCLDTLLIAGSGIPVELLRQAQLTLKCGFALSYGMTECCGGLTYLGPSDCTYDAGQKLQSAGKPLGDNQVRILGPDGKELPVGETGEIACLSRRVMKGYWNRPEASAEAMQDGWYLSGDAGYLDEDGYLYVVDRIKDMVVSGGENIYPVEIENELIKHPAVDDVAVIGVPDPKWGESLLACVVLSPGAEATPAELEQFLRGSLAGYKIPRRYDFVESFPRNATGKVLKRVMRDERSQVQPAGE